MKTLLLLVVAALSTAQATEKKMGDAYRAYTLKEGHFKCEFPSRWELRRDEASDAAEKTYGVTAVGPKDAGVAAALRVDFFASGNPQFADAAAYVARQTDAEDQALSGDPAPKVEKISFKGSAATRIRRDGAEIVPPKSMSAKKVATRTETLVVENAKGFFVLELSATAASFTRHRTAYKRLLDSFTLLK